jgi:hypothetical protein
MARNASAWLVDGLSGVPESGFRAAVGMAVRGAVLRVLASGVAVAIANVGVGALSAGVADGAAVGIAVAVAGIVVGVDGSSVAAGTSSVVDVVGARGAAVSNATGPASLAAKS